MTRWQCSDLDGRWITVSLLLVRGLGLGINKQRGTVTVELSKKKVAIHWHIPIDEICQFLADEALL